MAYFTVTVNGNDKTDYLSKVELSDKLDQISELKIVFAMVSRTDTDFTEGNIIKLYLNDVQKFKGTIQSATYDDSESYECTAYDQSVKLLQRKINNKLWEAKAPTGATSIFTDIVSEKLDSSAPAIMNVGTNTAYGATINFFVEYDNRLRVVSGVGAALGWDWWVDQDGSDNDQINIDTRRGSATSVYTFNTSGSNQNASIEQRVQDKDGMCNWLKAVGANAVERSLKVSFFASSNIYTSLSANITDVATTINVVSTTGFAAAGKIKIGAEIVTYTGTTGTSFTGCTRDAAAATDDTDQDLYLASEHFKGCLVFEYYDGVNYYYPETTLAYSKTGSSVKTYGIHEMVVPEKTVIHRATLELMASHYLEDKMVPIERVLLVSESAEECMNSITVGDNVTIVDEATDLSGLRRVIGRTIIMDMETGEESLKYEVTTKLENFLSSLSKTQNDVSTLNVGMEVGASTLQSQNMANVDATHPLYIPFSIPTDTRKIQHVYLTYDVDKYRTDFSTSAGGEATHTHGFTAGAETDVSAVTQRVLGAFGTSGVNAYDLEADGGAWTNITPTAISTADFTPDIEEMEIMITIGIRAGEGAPRAVRVRAFVNDEGADVYYPSEAAGKYLAVLGLYHITAFITIPRCRNIDTEEDGKIYVQAISADANIPKINSYVHWVASNKHTHEFTGTTTGAGSSHSHPINFSITDTDTTHTDINVAYTDNYVGQATSTWTDIPTPPSGGSWSLTRHADEELTAYFTSTGWKGIRITANGNARIWANILSKVYGQPGD